MRLPELLAAPPLPKPPVHLDGDFFFLTAVKRALSGRMLTVLQHLSASKFCAPVDSLCGELHDLLQDSAEILTHSCTASCF